jgi:hypothetical protein
LFWRTSTVKPFGSGWTLDVQVVVMRWKFSASIDAADDA